MARRPPDPRVNKTFWSEQYDKTGQLPITWLINSLSLKRAANIIFNQCLEDFEAKISSDPTDSKNEWPLTSIYMLLSGFALENLLKGIYIGRNPTFVMEGKLKKWSSKSGHELLDLAEKTKFELSEDETNLLERLTEFVVWAGKYPIPKQFENNMPRQCQGGGYEPPTFLFLKKDPELFDSLFERLSNILQDEFSSRHKK
jgi:hypothetical protein